MSASSVRSAWPSSSKRSRTSCASVCETLQPRKLTENVATRWMLLRRAPKDVGGPAALADSFEPSETGQARLVREDISGRDQVAALQARRDTLDDFERDVRDAHVGRRQRSGNRVDAATVDRDVVRSGIAESCFDRVLVDVEREHRPEAQLRRCDRDHAGAAADVEQAPTLELCQELECQPRRRMRTRSERAAGLDPARDHATRRLLPRRSDPEACDLDRLVKRAPAVLPTGLHVARGGVSEHVPETLFATG